MAIEYSGNFRIMDASGITQSMVGVRYTEDGKPMQGVISGVNTVSKLETYVTNSCVLLPADWKSWSLSNLPPTGLLCVHTEDYGLGEADNVLAEAERLRGKVLNEMRNVGNATGEGDGTTGTDTGTPGVRPPSNTPAGSPVPTTAPLVGDTDGDGKLSNREKKNLEKGN